jgi:hypothetical protein
LVSCLTMFPQHLDTPVRYQLTGPLSQWLESGLYQSTEGHGTERGGEPPDGIPGLPLLLWPNSLSSLDPAWTPRRNGPTHLAVFSGLSKHHHKEISPKSGPVPLDRRGAWSIPRNLQEEFHRSGTSPREGKETVITSVWICVCVNLLKAWAKFNLLLEF